MIQVGLLDANEINEVLTFYITHARDDVLYPRDSQWMRNHLGIDFFLVGIRISGDLVAVAWMTRFKDFVYFTVENESLLIHNDGRYAYSGGWLIRPDCRVRGLFQLLAATVNLFWFTKINNNNNENSILWGKMVGRKDNDGNPLFWNKVGEMMTGLSYRNLIELPFGTTERAIFNRWPKKSMPMQDFPQGIVEQTLGKTFQPLIGPLNAFLKWGFVEITNRYAPTSLNHFQRTTKNSIPNPQQFFDQALYSASN